MIIDAHQHVWDLATADYPWLDSTLQPIDRSMVLDEVLPAMQAVGVTATVLVQAADNSDDTENMLRVAASHPEVVGVVAWVPLDQPDLAAPLLEELRLNPAVVGIRTLLHTRPDSAWILGSRVDAGLGLLEAAGVPFDYVSGGHDVLAHLPAVGERHPGLRLVIDHLGTPPIGGSADQRRRWYQLMAAAAENPNVSAKLSGLYSAGDRLDDWTVEAVRPFVADALQLFGPERLMVGSDWPISLLAGGYSRIWLALTALVDELAPGSRDALMGGSAASFYSLHPERVAAAGAFAREIP